MKIDGHFWARKSILYEGQTLNNSYCLSVAVTMKIYYYKESLQTAKQDCLCSNQIQSKKFLYVEKLHQRIKDSHYVIVIVLKIKGLTQHNAKCFTKIRCSCFHH